MLDKEELKKARKSAIRYLVYRDRSRNLYEEYDESKLAMACAKKKLESSSSSDIEKQRGQLARFLDRKGFHSSIVYQLVTRLVPHVTCNDLDPPPHHQLKSNITKL